MGFFLFFFEKSAIRTQDQTIVVCGGCVHISLSTLYSTQFLSLFPKLYSQPCRQEIQQSENPPKRNWQTNHQKRPITTTSPSDVTDKNQNLKLNKKNKKRIVTIACHLVLNSSLKNLRNHIIIKQSNQQQVES